MKSISNSKQVSVIALTAGTITSMVGVALVWLSNPHEVFHSDGTIDYLNILLVFIIWNALISFAIFVLLLISIKLFYFFKSG